MIKQIRIDLTTKEELNRLEETSALTFVGLTYEEDIADNIARDIMGIDPATFDKEVKVYITSGKTMNEVYNLTGSNAYIDECSFLSIDNDAFGVDVRIWALRSKMYGGRWFDDIVYNNARREAEKKHTEECKDDYYDEDEECQMDYEIDSLLT